MEASRKAWWFDADCMALLGPRAIACSIGLTAIVMVLGWQQEFSGALKQMKKCICNKISAPLPHHPLYLQCSSWHPKVTPACGVELSIFVFS